MNNIRVLLADPQPLINAGLRYLLSERGDVQIVGEVNVRDMLLQKLIEWEPELLIIDHANSDQFSIDDLYKIKTTKPSTNILVISSDRNKVNIFKVLEAGVNGYVTKQCNTDEILSAVYATSKGEKFFCNTILETLLEKHFKKDSQKCDPTTLTTREVEIIKLIAEGFSTMEIAERLYVSHHTINTHRKNILKKLNVKNPAELAIYAIETGLIRPKID